jgi:serine/threonine-protein kinase
VVTLGTRADLAGAFVRQGRYAEADSTYRQAIAALRAMTADSHRAVRRAYASVAQLYDAWGKRDSAAVYRQRAGSVDLRNLWP